MTVTRSSSCRGMSMIAVLLCLTLPHNTFQGKQRSTPRNSHPNLLFATQTDIRIANIMKPPKVNSLIKDLKDVAAVDYYYEGGLICWTDHGLEMIQCAEYNGTAVTNKYDVINNGLILPDGLACDWVTKKLYWTDGETNRIEVATLRGKHRKVLIWTDIDQPRAIALVPSESLMFWTDWGEVPKIERAGMDGDPKTRKTIVTDDIFWPNGLTIDLVNRTIYWIDGHLKFIESMDFDGRNRRRILDNDIKYPFGLDFYQNRLFWSDWEKLAIYSYEIGAAQPRDLLHGEYIPNGLRVWDPSRQPPSKSPCQERNGGCSHLCLLSASNPKGYSCACPTGVRLLNETTCANGPHEMLIVVQRTDICWISLDSADFSQFIIPVTGIKHAIGVDYDPAEKFVYWTDDEARVLRRAHLDGRNQKDLINTEVQHPGGIAIDWVARNMYWTDSGTDRIEVARLNGDYRRVLVNKDLNEPRAIAVAPDLGLLFWSDWYEPKPKIERTCLDGSDRIAIVSTLLGWPNGIALDLDKNKIYWCDAKLDKIEVANMDGGDRKEVANRELPHLFGLSLLGDYLYWTDWQRRNIERIDKNTGDKREVIIEQMPNLMDLKAIRLGPIKGTNPCGYDNGGCSHLCLNRPNNNYVCFCQIAYELASDNKTCYLPDAFLLYAQKENISKASLENRNIDLVIPVKGVREANNLDFDFFTDHIYWTDTVLKTISKAYRNGSDVERLVEVGLESPKGLAVDWVAQNLFWTDSVVKRIEVSRLNGCCRRVILWSNMGDPRSIALHPFEGYIYWSNWDATGSIERAAMDGSQREMVVEKVGRPNGLTIDLAERRLYWTELTSPAIEYYDLKNKIRHKIITNELYEPTGLAYYKDRIYWSDAKSGLIESANKNNGKNRKVIHSFLPGVSDIKVFYNVSQYGQTPCSRNYRQCSHLCLSVPDPIHSSKAIARCSCPSHWRLQSDNRTCQEPRSFILSSTRNTIIRILPDSKDNCPYILLPIQGLKNLRGIEFDPVKQHIYWIDGRAHAIKRAYPNGSHAGILIPPGPNQIIDLALDHLGRSLYWTDDEYRSINVTRLDGNSTTLGIVYEGVNEDEKPHHLAIHPEQGLLFWTDVGSKRIMRSQLDGNQTYIIAQLYQNPTALTIDRKNSHVCWAVGRSIECANLEGHERWTVMDDGPPVLSLTVHGEYIYFWNKENEKFERIHKTTHYGGTVINILPQYRKNLTDILAVEFPDISKLEEHPCSERHNYGGCSHLCTAGLRHSASSSVTSIAAICSCPKGLVLARNNNTCRPKSICGADDFACVIPTKKDCIPSAWRCDGQPDCDDSSDEMNCQNQTCQPDFFQCPNGNCIPPALVCDGSPHCPDQSDELNCCKQPGQFMCRSTIRCIPPTSVCDRIFHCEDGSDEAPQMCSKLSGENRPIEVPTFTSNKSTYVLISIFVLVAVISSIVVFTCRRRLVKQNSNLAGYLDDCARDPLSPKPNQAPPPMISKKSRKANGFAGAGCPSSGFHGSDSVHMSMINGSSSTNSYDRGHLTGASSSITEGACALQPVGYPLETLNPPPSPATTADSNSRRTRNGHLTAPDDYCCNSSGTGTSRYRPYRHYRTINQPPPPTPCSTDVCDESDSNFTNHRQRYYHHHHHHHHHPGSEYDSDPFPPPPTPRSHYLSDVPSCPPSPSSTAGRSSTYFNPYPPPPSPVPSPGDS